MRNFNILSLLGKTRLTVGRVKPYFDLGCASGVGGPCHFSVSPSPFGLELWTLDLGLTKRYIVFFIALGGGLGGGGNKCYIFFSLFFRKRPLERHQTLT